MAGWGRPRQWELQRPVAPFRCPVRPPSKLLGRSRSHRGGAWALSHYGGCPERRAVGLVAGLQEAERFRIKQVVPGVFIGCVADAVQSRVV